tara:strand:+ start:1974 stop:2342 length:369 start_codon:yes stop_codon:yes gene_type:complete
MIQQKFKTMQSNGLGEFITQIEDVPVFFHYTHEPNIGASVSIRWRFDVELRDYGVKSINAYTVQAQVEIINLDTLEVIEIIDTNEFKSSGWTLEDEGINLNHSIGPTDCSIDYKDSSIFIEW